MSTSLGELLLLVELDERGLTTQADRAGDRAGRAFGRAFVNALDSHLNESFGAKLGKKMESGFRNSFSGKSVGKQLAAEVRAEFEAGTKGMKSSAAPPQTGGGGGNRPSFGGGIGFGSGGIAAGGVGGVALGVTGAVVSALGSSLKVAADAAGVFGGAIVSASQQGMAFSQVLKTIEVMTGATTSQMKGIENAIGATVGKFGRMPQEVAAVTLELTRMNVAAKDIPARLNAVFAVAGSTGEGSDVASKLINQLKAIYADSSDTQIADVISVGANQSPGGLEDLANSLKYLAPVADQAHLSLSELTAVVVKLQTAGLNGSSAGTGGRAIIKDLGQDSAFLKTWGVEVYDAAGKSKDFNEILNLVAQRLSTLDDSQKASFLSKFSANSKTALLALTTLSTKSPALFKQIDDGFQNLAGSSEKMATSLQDTGAGAIGKLLANSTLLVTKFGQSFEGAVKGGANYLNEVATSLLKNDKLFEALSTAAEEFQAYLADNPQYIGVLTEAITELATGAFTWVLDKARELIEELQRNPQLIQETITNAQMFVEQLGAAVNGAVKLFQALSPVLDLMTQIKNQSDLGSTIESLGQPLQDRVNARSAEWKGSGFLGGTDDMNKRRAIEIEEMNKMNDARDGYDPNANRPDWAGGNGGSASVDAVRLATLAILESPTRQGRVDAAVAVDNRVNATKIGEGNYGNNITEVAFAPGQFEPFFNLQANQLNSLEAAAKIIAQRQGISVGEATQLLKSTIGDLQNSTMVADSRRFLGGRTDFKGVTEYGNRVASEDPLRQDGENFYHISPGQSYDQLARILAAGSGGLIPGSSATARRPGEDTITTGITGGSYGNGSWASGSNRNVAPVGIRTAPGQEYGASRDGGARAHAGEDFDLAQGQSSTSYLGGVVQDIQDWGEWGKAAVIYNAQLGVTEIVAEMQQVFVKVGQEIAAGTAVGTGGDNIGGVQHTEIHKGKGRTNDTVDPLAFYASIGVDPKTGKVYAGGGESGNGGNPGGLHTPGLDLDGNGVPLDKDESMALAEARKNRDATLKLERDQADLDRKQKDDATNQALQFGQDKNQGTALGDVYGRQLQREQLRQSGVSGMVDNSRKLDDLQFARQNAVEDEKTKPSEDVEGFKQYLATLDSAIAKTKEYGNALAATSKEKLDQFDAVNLAAVERLRQEDKLADAQRDSDLAYRSQVNTQQAYSASLNNPTLREFVDLQIQLAENANTAANELKPLEDELNKTNTELSAFLMDENSTPGDPFIARLAERKTSLEGHLTALREVQKAEQELMAQQVLAKQESFQSGLLGQVQQGTFDQMNREGQTFEANDYMRNIKTEEENKRYNDEVTAIAGMGLNNDELARSLDLATQLNTLNLNNIQDQFKSLGATIGSIGSDALGGFVETLLTDVTNIGGAIQGLIKDTISQFAKLATQRLLFEVLGAGSGLKIPGFAEGGLVPNTKGSSPGKDSVLAMLMPGEFVLSHQMMRDIPKFADGGFVGAGRLKPNMATPTGGGSGGGISINAPMSFAGGGNGGGNSNTEEAKTFQRLMESEMMRVVARESQPNGILERMLRNG